MMTGNEDLTVQFGEDPPWDDDPPENGYDEYPGGYSDYDQYQQSKGWCST